jgi:hypothetical protein
VLASDEEAARQHLSNALANVREPWEPESTGKNLKLIAGARKERGVDEPWVEEIISSLQSP